jgi:DNA-binding NarL/FixJ family response regulator
MTGSAASDGKPASTVVVCDDRVQIRQSLREVLRYDPALTLVGEAWDLSSCEAVVRQHGPDVLILDVNIPGGGIAAAQAVKLISPGTRIVAFSGRYERTVAEAMLSAGSDVFVLKTGRIKPLIDALRAVRDSLASVERPRPG